MSPVRYDKKCGMEMYDPCGNQLSNMVKKLYKSIIIGIAVILILHIIIENSSAYFRTMYRPFFSVHLNKTDVVMAKGEEFKLRLIGINERVKYSSTDFRIAGVNFNGRVYAYQTGQCFIIAKAGKKELKCRVIVIDINKERLSLRVGESYRLKIKGRGGIPNYKSSNPKVASVSWTGKVKAVSKGRTVITVRAKGKSFKCTVNVK